jgi:hypothetical protein
VPFLKIGDVIMVKGNNLPELERNSQFNATCGVAIKKG